MINKFSSKSILLSSATTFIAIAISLMIALFLIFVFSDTPKDTLLALITGPLSSKRNFGTVITMMSTITFTGLAVSIMFQAALFNIAAESAFFFGGLMAAATVTMLDVPVYLALLAPLAVGAIAGAIVCVIPGLLKARYNADELVASLMLNYIILYLGQYLIYKFLRDINYGALATLPLPDRSTLPNLIAGTSVHSGIIIASVLILFCYIFIYKTKIGYAIRLVGHNKEYANYSGINVSKIIVISQLVGGVIAGLGGAVEVMGMYSRFQWTALPGYGWDGVIVAILVKNKPQYVPIAALFIAYLRVGANVMARNTDIPAELVTVIQAIMIILVTASALLSHYKKKLILKEALTGGENN